MDGLGEDAQECFLLAHGPVRRPTGPECRMVGDLLRPSASGMGFGGTGPFVGEHPGDDDQLLGGLLVRGAAFRAVFCVGYVCGHSEFPCLEIKSAAGRIMNRCEQERSI